MLDIKHIRLALYFNNGQINFMDKTATLFKELEEISLKIQRKRSQINHNNKKLDCDISRFHRLNTEDNTKLMDSQITTLKLDAIIILAKLSTKISEL